MPLPLISASPTVLAGGKGVVRVSDKTKPCTIPVCAPGGPGVVAKGSTTVKVNNLPCARLNDPTAHLGCVAPVGAPTGKITGPGIQTVIIGG
jgi:uncharacterized Zn-binding protein involved in type VI secretion